MKVLLNLLKLGCLAFFVAGGCALWLLWGAVSPAVREGEAPPRRVAIPEGATARQISALLKENGIIANEVSFRALIRYSKKGGEIKAGKYELSARQSPLDILEVLVEGKTIVEARVATLPEGLTLKEVARRLAEKEVVAEDEFLKLATTGGKKFGADLPANLEGYLFPDTYQFPMEATAEDVVKILLDRFREVVDPLWSEKSPLPLHQTVVLASLVEREAQVSSERPLIAGVYMNRLEKEMPLECDATVQYALGKHKEVLLYADLEVDSPYNTYRNPGLPPGPIANPGRAALEAATSPKKSEYLFYVRNDVKGDGSHVFSRSFAEHEQARARYQR